MATVKTSELRISVLGSASVDIDGESLEVDTRKATALLVYLAVSGRTHSRDHLTGLLWPDYDQERARAALRRTLSALRKALGDRWVTADRYGLRLDDTTVYLDLAEFRRRVDQASTHGHDETRGCPSCIEALVTAVDLVQGRFLQGFSLRDAEPFEEWQSLEGESIERELHGALDRLVKALVASGELERAVGVAQRKLSLDGLDEPAHRQLMQLYAWRGMRTQALQQYRDCVAILDRELGVPPLAETTALYESIGDGSVEAVETTRLDRPENRARAAPRRQEHPLRAREREMERLRAAYEAVSGRGAFVSIEGEAGIGKTRLAAELLADETERGAEAITARGYEGETGLPYALITQLLNRLLDRGEHDPASLGEVARLVPGASPESVPGSIEDPGALARFFEGVRRVIVTSLEGSRPGIMFLDDLQWCDPASLDAISYLVRRLEDTPLCVIAAWRTEEVDQDHPLRRLVMDTSRAEFNHSIVLRRLGPDEVRSFVAADQTSGDRDAQRMADRLVAETEGIPLFIVEYLAVMADEESVDWQMPTSIKELMRQRASSVGQTARQVLGAAAVIDRSFDFETVWRAGGRTELETLDALDELVAHGLVTQASIGDELSAFEFSHDKLRSFVYESMSPARRRVLHRRVAEAFLAAAKRRESPGSDALAARHLELGGREAEAARHHALAAEQARRVFANADALQHFLSALALGHPDPASLHEGAGDMYVLLGEYNKAVDAYRTAAAHAKAPSLPGLEHKLGEVHLRRGEWDLAQSHFGVALEALADNDDLVMESRLLAAMSFNAHRRGHMDEAVSLDDRALEAARASGDTRSIAQALNQKGILDNARGRLDDARAELEESLGLALELDDVGGRVAALNNLAHTARSDGALDEALELARQALATCMQQGDSHRQAAIHNNIADLLHEQGDTDAAMEHLKQATAILAKIGQEPAGLLPEVWKLVEW